MELEVLVSNKGTKVITATHLYQILELPVQNYGLFVRRWLKDVYAFRDGIRRPLVMKDYAPRKTRENQVSKDYSCLLIWQSTSCCIPVVRLK